MHELMHALSDQDIDRLLAFTASRDALRSEIAAMKSSGRGAVGSDKAPTENW